MLRLHQSHRLEILAEILAAEYEPPASPFQPDIYIVQSHGMGRWVSLRLAERLGICANARFALPATFVWDLLREHFGELPKRSPFAAEVLAFRIMAWLNEPGNLDQAPRLAGYLKDGGELRRFQLAARIADVFDQYLVYREDWITAWERGEKLGLDGDEDWQALLWRDLAAGETAWHRARLMGELLERIRGKEATAIDPPHPNPLPRGEGKKARITVFGVSSLPPVFLDVLRALGERGEVVVYALNPCREYWGEIKDPREIGRLAGERRPEDLYLEVGHPLLASLGKQGREFFDALSECAETHGFFDEEPQRDSLLHILQADILELVDRKAVGSLALEPGDRSLQIHVCHSPMREVEVLRDQLLALFDADASLKPGDVAVLTPDIEKYTPYIEAVFAEGRDAPRLPFSIADRGLAHQHSLLETFLALLDLPDSRFCADATLAFLEQPALRRRFRLAEDDLPQIHDWARAVGARWGRDGAHKAEHGLPAMDRHTWRDGLRRLMLGYALPQELAGDELPLFGATLPYDDIEGGRALVLGHFAEFMETLFEWAERLRGDRLPVAWSEALNALADALFEPRGEEEAVLLELRNGLDALRDLPEQAGFREPLGLRTVKSWLTARLGQPSGSVGFLTGEVTFCAMVPMRSLPFRIIALLGLNYDTFPRHRPPPGFDLMARHPRRGDRSRRLDDRYLFLETLLSARDKLYLSYVGRGIRDNSPLPPSPLVSELIDVVKQSVDLPDGGDVEALIVTEHPLQPFDPAYFSGNPRLPGYSANWLAAARRIGWGEKEPVPLFDGALPEPEQNAWATVGLEDLLAFFGNPARFLLQRRLNVVFEAAASACEIREPFGFDYFSALSIRKDCLDALIGGHPADRPARLAEARGLLPHGTFGARLHAREQAAVERFLPVLRPFLAEDFLDPLPVRVEADSIALAGWLRRVSRYGLVEAIPDQFRARHALGLWLRHLLLCHLQPEAAALESRLFCLDRTVRLSAVAEPERELRKLLDLFRQGLRRPLPFFVKSAYAYAERIVARGTDPASALEAARKVWEAPEFRNGNHYGESENPYYQAVYRGTLPLDDEFEALALDILGPYFNALATDETP
jgi:exodeoxyribonuclease V gamma subunit